MPRPSPAPQSLPQGVVLAFLDGACDDGPLIVSLQHELVMLLRATQDCHSVCRYYGVLRQPPSEGGKLLIVMAKYERSLAALIRQQGGCLGDLLGSRVGACETW